MEINMSLLNVTTGLQMIPSESDQYVPIEMCKAYVEGTLKYNRTLHIICGVLFILLLLNMWRNGQLDEDIKRVKNWFKGD